MGESNPPVSTGRGDDGTTTLLGSGRMGKNDPRIIVLGDVDEASSFLGLARAEADGDIGELLLRPAAAPLPRHGRRGDAQGVERRGERRT